MEAVANHHHPSRVAAEAFDVLGAVHVANALAQGVAPVAADGPAPERLDLDYLQAMGVADELPAWRDEAAAEAEALAEAA